MTGGGDDFFAPAGNDVFGDRLQVFTGSGNDTIFFIDDDAMLLGPMVLKTGIGDDAVVFVRSDIVVSDRVTIATAGGDDGVVFNETIFDGKVKVDLGPGHNDTLDVEDSLFGGPATFIGGAGTADQLIDGAGFSQPPTITGFEILPTM